MNKENILLVAEHLENLPEDLQKVDCEADEGFDLRNFTHDCGTPSCIAGYAAWFDNGKRITREYLEATSYYFVSKTAEFFGMTYDDAHDLCLPGSKFREDTRDLDETIDPYEVTAKQAAAVLRHFAETGEVDYRVAFPEVSKAVHCK